MPNTITGGADPFNMANAPGVRRPVINVIPTVNIGASPISLPSYSTLADTAASPSERQLTLAAANAPLRYTYGLDRIAPLIVNALLDSAGALLLDCVIGEGPIGGVVTTEINDAAVPAGVTVTVYDGTQVTADASLVAAWALQSVVFADIRPGIAYAVIKITAGVDIEIDERSIAFTVQGLKCYDPRQNRILHSEAANNAAWTKSNLTPGSTPVAAYDGVLRAYTLTENTAVNVFHDFSQSGGTLTSGLSYTLSAKVKSNGRTKGALGFYLNTPFGGGSNYPTNNFDLAAGTANGIGGATSVSILSLGSGWYLLTVTGLCTSTTAAVPMYIRPHNASNVAQYTGDGASGLIVDQMHYRLATASEGYVVTTASIYDQPTAYTNNQALILADFLAHSTRGPGDTLDWNSVGVVAERADQLLATKKRHTFGLTFDEQRPKRDVEETLRAGVCFVVREGPTTYLVADAPVDVSGTTSFATADWQPRELRYSQRDAAAAPNRITVRYTNTAVKPWGEAYTESIESPDVTAGLVDAVEMVVNATWIQDYAEAIRLRNRYFAEHTLGLKTLEFPVFEKGYKLRRGDVIRLTNGIDLAAKPVRVQRMVAMGFARVKIVAQEYQPAMYSDDTPAGPGYPSTNLPDPRTVLPVTALAMTEEVYLDQAQAAAIASGAKYVSRFRITWTASLDRYLVDNVVKFYNGTQLVFEGPCTGAEYVSPPVQQGQGYTVEVRARNVLGFLSAVAAKSATALGKLLAPGAVPRISQAIEIGGEVLLAWDPSVDIDVIRYEWRYTPNSTAGSWESATLIDRVDGLRTRFKGLPVGTHRFYVKPIDSVSQYSTSATYADVTVTSDADAYLQSTEFVNPTMPFRILAYRVDGERHQRWITNWDGTWDANFTAAMSTYTNPIATYGFAASTISRFESEIVDMSAPVSGDWTYAPNAVDIGGGGLGTWIQTGLTSPPGTVQSGLTFSATARYVRAYVSTNVAGQAFHITRPPELSLAAVSRKESAGPVTSSAGAATTISLTGKYFKVVRITITPRGTVARMSTINNIVLSLSGANSFDVYLFDQAGTQVASDFNWDFEGV